MRQYRPDVERQKLLYSRMKSYALAESRLQLTDNSVPWLSEVTCVADAIKISDRIKEDMEKRYLAELPATTEERAVEMLERFLTPKVAEAALAHPSETVRQRAMSFLRELAAEGDPFAADILKNLLR